MAISTLKFQTNTEQQTYQEPYLRLQLNSETQAVISMKQMQEVLTAPVERITPIPNLPKWLIGLLNQRSRIYWVMDLPQFLGLSPLDPDPSAQNWFHTSVCNIAMVRVNNCVVGLSVQQVYSVIRFPVEMIRSPVGVVAASIEPYLRGCVLHQEGILWVLEPAAIIKGAETALQLSGTRD